MEIESPSSYYMIAATYAAINQEKERKLNILYNQLKENGYVLIRGSNVFQICENGTIIVSKSACKYEYDYEAIIVIGSRRVSQFMFNTLEECLNKIKQHI